MSTHGHVIILGLSTGHSETFADTLAKMEQLQTLDLSGEFKNAAPPCRHCEPSQLTSRGHFQFVPNAGAKLSDMEAAALAPSLGKLTQLQVLCFAGECVSTDCVSHHLNST